MYGAELAQSYLDSGWLECTRVHAVHTLLPPTDMMWDVVIAHFT